MKPQAPTARHMLLASAAMALAFMAGAATAEEKPKEHADTPAAAYEPSMTTLAQIHALTADDLITGAPALSAPAMTAVVAVIAAYGTVTSPAAAGAICRPLAASWEYILTEAGELLLTESGEVLETEASSAARATAVTMPAQSGAVAGAGTMAYEYILTEAGEIILTEAGGALETEMSGVTAGAVQMPAPVGSVVTQETL